MEMLIIFGWMLFWGIACGAVGARNSRGFVGFLLGGIFGPIGLLLVVWDNFYHPSCPLCKETIKRGAARCGNCGADLARAAPSAAPSMLKCPICAQMLLARSVEIGDNTCPKCRGVFTVEE